MAERSDKEQPIFQRLDQCTRFPYTKTEYARRFLWNCCQYTLYRYSFRQATGFRRFLLRLFGAKIASEATLAPTSRIFHPWLFELGEWCSVGHGVNVYNLGPVTIGEHTSISQDVHVCAGTHDYTLPHLPLRRPPIRIGRGVWIGAEAFIGPGVTIGDNSVIGARAVVIRDIPPGVVAAGNPARVIRARTMRQESSTMSGAIFPDIAILNVNPQA